MKKFYLLGLSFLALGISSISAQQNKAVSAKFETKNIKLAKSGFQHQFIKSLNKNESSFEEKTLTLFWESNFDNASQWSVYNMNSDTTFDWQIIDQNGLPAWYTGGQSFLIPNMTGNFAFFDSFEAGEQEQNAVVELNDTIDCSGKFTVILKFNSFYTRWDAEEALTVEVSNDGSNYTSYEVHQDAEPFDGQFVYPSDNPEEIEVNISDVAGNQGTVFIRFRYEGGQGIAWSIDDVRLYELTGLDGRMIALGPVPGWEYILTPVAQVVDDYDFVGYVQNLASDDIVSAFITISSVGIGYSENVVTGTISSGNEEEVSSMYDGAALGGVGTLQIFYNLDVTIGIDDDLTNNLDTFDWNFTDSTYGAVLGVTNYYPNSDSLHCANFFQINNQDTLTSTSAFMYFSQAAVGSEITLFVQEVINDTTFGNVLGISEPFVVTVDDTGQANISEISFNFPDVVMPEGRYIIGYHDVYPGIANVLFNNQVKNGSSIWGIADQYWIDFNGIGTWSFWAHFGVPDMVTGIRNQITPGSITVFPNPTSNILNIELSELSSELVSIELFNSIGQLVQSKMINANLGTAQLNVAELNTGIYTLQVKDGQTSFSQKVEIK